MEKKKEEKQQMDDMPHFDEVSENKSTKKLKTS